MVPKPASGGALTSEQAAAVKTTVSISVQKNAGYITLHNSCNRVNRWGRQAEVSEVLQINNSLQVLQPVRRPAGSDAGPLLHPSVILPQVGVPISSQPTEPEEMFHTSKPNRQTPAPHFVAATDPNLKSDAMVGNTTTSASVKDCPAR